jgi:hypothetical protein
LPQRVSSVQPNQKKKTQNDYGSAMFAISQVITSSPFTPYCPRSLVLVVKNGPQIKSFFMAYLIPSTFFASVIEKPIMT